MDKLQKNFSDRYLNGSDVTDTLPDGVKRTLVAWIDYEYANLPCKVSLVPVHDSYASVKELFADIENNNHLYIYSEDCEHPLWDIATNQKFRAIHDFRHHFQVGLHSDFSLYGEFQAYSKAVSDFDIWLSAYGASYLQLVQKILFSEIVLQAAVCHETGEFAAQKIVF